MRRLRSPCQTHIPVLPLFGLPAVLPEGLRALQGTGQVSTHHLPQHQLQQLYHPVHHQQLHFQSHPSMQHSDAAALAAAAAPAPSFHIQQQQPGVSDSRQQRSVQLSGSGVGAGSTRGAVGGVTAGAELDSWAAPTAAELLLFVEQQSLHSSSMDAVMAVWREQRAAGTFGLSTLLQPPQQPQKQMQQQPQRMQEQRMQEMPQQASSVQFHAYGGSGGLQLRSLQPRQPLPQQPSAALLPPQQRQQQQQSAQVLQAAGTAAAAAAAAAPQLWQAVLVNAGQFAAPAPEPPGGALPCAVQRCRCSSVVLAPT